MLDFFKFSVKNFDSILEIKTVNGNEITGEVINKTVTLDIGVHDFKYTITDEPFIL